VRNQKAWSWSAPFHYADTPDWSCDYVPADCPKEGCIVTAISNYTAQLSGGSKQSQEAAIRFVVHFHGDIHQPLHCGFLSNLGGNQLTGTYFGSPNNLHSIWDTSLITTRLQNDFGNNQDKYVDYLVAQINGQWKNDAPGWLKCPKNEYPCPAEWASESAKLACDYAYTDQNGKKIAKNFVLAQPYYENVKDVVDLQLAKGGYRLAETLNQKHKIDLAKSRFIELSVWMKIIVAFSLGLVVGIIGTMIVFSLKKSTDGYTPLSTQPELESTFNVQEFQEST